MAEVLPVGLPPLPEGHVAQAPRRLGEDLRADLRVGLPREVVVVAEPVDRAPVDRLAADEVDPRFADDLHGGAGFYRPARGNRPEARSRSNKGLRSASPRRSGDSSRARPRRAAPSSSSPRATKAAASPNRAS